MAIQRPYAETDHTHLLFDDTVEFMDDVDIYENLNIYNGDITVYSGDITLSSGSYDANNVGVYKEYGYSHKHQSLHAHEYNDNFVALSIIDNLGPYANFLAIRQGAGLLDDILITAASSGTEGSTYENQSIDIQSLGTGILKYNGVEISTIDHNHDSDYLGLTATASNSLLLGGASAAEFASSDHLHTGVYEPASADIQTHITTVSGNPHSVTYTEVGAASTDHNHDLVYLAINGTADNSLLLDGASAAEFATSDHTHDMDDIIVDTTLRLLPQVEFGRIQATSKPTIVSRGVVQGYSLPIYNSDDEELFFTQSVPRRWDEASNITFGCMAMLDTANTDKKFKLAIEWEQVTAGDVVGTSTVTASTEIDVTGAASQYMTYDVTMTVDYDANTPDVIEANDVLAIRLRRVAASADEITGEVVVYGFYIQYNRDKIGA